jgi:multidomain signaling protein FimX
MTDIFNQKIEQLRQQYDDSLPLRAHRLDEIWGHLQHLNWSQEGVTALQQFAHKLAGTATSFGYPELSFAARQLDSYITDLVNLERHFGGLEHEHITARVEQLKSALLKSHPSSFIKPQPPMNLTQYDKHTRLPAPRGELIYIIDPDTTLSSLLCIYLQEAGFSIDHFETPQDCIQHLYTQTPDAILIDLDFEHSGIHALSVLQQMKALISERVPLLLMSARTDLSAKLRALRAGSSDYLTKPLDFQFLIAKLRNSMNQHRRVHKIMIVDDDPDMSTYEAEILRSQGMDVFCLNKPLVSLKRAAEYKPDLVILDMHMPDINGIELAILLRQDPQFFLLPIIFATSDTSIDLHKNIKALGVNGLLIKPIAASDLIEACHQALINTDALKNRVARITQRTHQPQQITRSYFFAAVNHELQNSSLGKDLSALYYLSISDLEGLNLHLSKIEQFSLHDQLCKHLSAVVGSDELWVDLTTMVACILASKRSPSFHQQRSAQLTKYLCEQDYRIGGKVVPLALNLSITHLNPALGNANQALIQAERSFNQEILKDTVLTPDPISISAKSINPDKIDFQRDLVLAFQPIISLEAAHIDHFLVLTRLRREDGELIPAAQFLNHIDQPGRHLELDRWVLQEAVSAITRNNNTREEATLFIHLAETTLSQNAFFSLIANVLRSSRLRGAQRLVFMLEEAWVINNLTHAKQLALALTNIDCGLCLTRAGAHPESMQLLQSLELHYLRLDPELVQAPSAHPDLETYITTANQLGIQVIATQIEDAKSLSQLWMLGIRLFEGFFIQPPDSDFHVKNEITLPHEPQPKAF